MASSTRAAAANSRRKRSLFGGFRKLIRDRNSNKNKKNISNQAPLSSPVSVVADDDILFLSQTESFPSWSDDIDDGNVHPSPAAETLEAHLEAEDDEISLLLTESRSDEEQVKEIIDQQKHAAEHQSPEKIPDSLDDIQGIQSLDQGATEWMDDAVLNQSTTSLGSETGEQNVKETIDNLMKQASFVHKSPEKIPLDDGHAAQMMDQGETEEMVQVRIHPSKTSRDAEMLFTSWPVEHEQAVGNHQTTDAHIEAEDEISLLVTESRSDEEQQVEDSILDKKEHASLSKSPEKMIPGTVDEGHVVKSMEQEESEETIITVGHQSHKSRDAETQSRPPVENEQAVGSDALRPATLAVGHRVRIIGPTHTGKKGHIVKITSKTFRVHIQGLGDRHLKKKNVELDDESAENESATGSNDVAVDTEKKNAPPTEIRHHSTEKIGTHDAPTTEVQFKEEAQRAEGFPFKVGQKVKYRGKVGTVMKVMKVYMDVHIEGEIRRPKKSSCVPLGKAGPSTDNSPKGTKAPVSTNGCDKSNKHGTGHSTTKSEFDDQSTENELLAANDVPVCTEKKNDAHAEIQRLGTDKIGAHDAPPDEVPSPFNSVGPSTDPCEEEEPLELNSAQEAYIQTQHTEGLPFSVGQKVKIVKGKSKDNDATVKKVMNDFMDVYIEGTGIVRRKKSSCIPRGQADPSSDNSPKTTRAPVKAKRRNKNKKHQAGASGLLGRESLETNGEEWRVADSKSGGSRIGTRLVVKIRLALEKDLVRDTFLTHMFHTRLRIQEIPMNTEELQVPYETVLHDNGSRYELVSRKVLTDGDEPSWGYSKSKCIRLYYVQVTGPGLTPICLRDFLLCIADFSKLTPRKVMARLDLFLSPACMIPGIKSSKILSKNEKLAKFPLRATMFSVTEPNGNDGCGFVCEKFLESLLGGNAEAKRALCIQIRTFIPSMGVFKGMLCRKRIASGNPPIELDPTMLKVGPSWTSNMDDRAFLFIRTTMPSGNNWHTGRLLDPLEKSPPKKSFEIKKLKDMIPRLWKGLGVPEEVCDDYVEKSVLRSHLNHAWVVGLADPTGSIPPGHIFVTGMRGKVAMQDKLFVTRSPCTKPEDGRVIPNLVTKPADMSTEDWDWLKLLGFGAIIFGAPKDGMRPLPELIAKGDLDGDLYFVCWNQAILSNIHALPFEDVPIEEEEPSSATATESREDWLERAQKLMVDAASVDEMDRLTGQLHKFMLQASDSSELNIADPDAMAFADAFNQSLEFAKHGKPIYLPSQLQEKLPQSLRKFLTDDR